MLSRSLEHTLHAALAQASLLLHQYVTLEHLLVALLEDHDAASVLSICRVNQEQLRAHLMEAMAEEPAAPVGREQHNPFPTPGFQRVVQRAGHQVQSSGRSEITGADILISLFAEDESRAAYFLQLQGITEHAVRSAATERAAGRKRIFVALCPGPGTDDICRQGIIPAIRAAGHLAEGGGTVEPVDGVTSATLAQIRQSRLVIADYTTADGAVDFLIGFAIGAGIPVIVTCRADGTAVLSEDDIRFRDMVVWRTMEELTDRLAHRIAIALDHGKVEADDSVDQTVRAATLDRINAAVKELLEHGKRRGYVTYDELDAALPSEQVSSELIENTMAMLQAMNIDIVEKGHGDIAI